MSTIFYKYCLLNSINTSDAMSTNICEENQMGADPDLGVVVGIRHESVGSRIFTALDPLFSGP